MPASTRSGPPSCCRQLRCTIDGNCCVPRAYWLKSRRGLACAVVRAVFVWIVAYAVNGRKRTEQGTRYDLRKLRAARNNL